MNRMTLKVDNSYILSTFAVVGFEIQETALYFPLFKKLQSDLCRLLTILYLVRLCSNNVYE